MGSFWDERARENAAYFVDNTLDYRGSDLEDFWARGPEVLDRVLGVVEAPAIAPDDDVVEIGCGVGRLTRPLSERARTVRALDVSAEMLAQAREHNPQLANVEWIHGDGTSLTGIGDASADVVFSHVVFQHVPDPAITLGYVREMGRVLRPGGWAAFQISNDSTIHRPRPRRLRDRLATVVGRAPSGQDDPAWLGSAVELDALEAAARDGGLTVERVTGAGTQFCIVLLARRDAPLGP
jgi:SAM-dependent methyltransferase